MQVKNLLFATTLIAQISHAQPEPSILLDNEKINIPIIETITMIKHEASQIKDALKAMDQSKDLAANHFSQPQLRVLKELALRFIQCTEQQRNISICADLRTKMNNVDLKGQISNERKRDNDRFLMGAGDVLSGLGDAYQTINDPEQLIAEYSDLLLSIPKSAQRVLPTLTQFSALKPVQMQDLLNQKIYPLIGKLVEGFVTPDKTLSSEGMWNSQTKCEDAIGFNHIDNETTDDAYRCTYGQLDANGILKNKEFPLKYYTPCVKDQANRGTCSAFATVGALEIRLLKNKNQEFNLSEQFTYFYNEIYGGWWGRYEYGVTTMNTLKTLKKKSLPIPLETHWVYNPSNRMGDYNSSTKKHPDSCVDYSGQKCTGYAFQSGETQSGLNFIYTVPSKPKPHVMVNSRYSFWNFLNPEGSLDTAINYLKNGDPIVVAFTVKDNFQSKGGGDNYVKYSDVEGGGGHAAVLVGFVKNDDLPAGAEKATEKGFFVLRNSWGGQWADCGHIYVDYKYMKKYAYGLARITYNYQN